MRYCSNLVVAVVFILFSSVYGFNDLLEEDNYLAKYEIIDWNEFNLDHICDQGYWTEADVSKPCQDQLTVVCNNRTLTVTMLDASSKFPWSGVLKYTSALDYGNFDECLEIDHEEKVNGTNVRVLGMHCTPGLLLPKDNTFKNFYQLALCKPHKCSAADFGNLISHNINNATYQRIIKSLFVDNSCATKESGTDYSSGDIAIIAIFGVFLAFLITSTLYDIYLYKKKQKSIHPIFISFSVLSNGKKLLQHSKGHKGNKEQILCFHGLKYISMWWIMNGHTYAPWQVLPATNAQTAIPDFMSSMRSFFTSPANLAVDTFFYVSGFLLAYQYLKQRPRPFVSHLLNVPKLYLHRYLRLTPPVLMLYLYVVGISTHVGSGPLFTSVTQSMRQPCIDYWWSFFLYIQNYYNPENFCVTHTWYLSSDMQLFLVAPIAMIPIALCIKKNFKGTMIAMAAMNIFFTVLPLTYVIWQDLYYNEYEAHSRLIDYWIGFMLGAYMREKKDKPFKISGILNILIWIVVLAEMLACVLLYKYMEVHQGYVENRVYFSIMRPAWCLGLSWIVFSCHHGYGGVVNWLLCSALMQFGSKITYCIYLTHGQIIYYNILSAKAVKHFSVFYVFYEWCGTFVLSTVIATIASLAFESPIIIIERMIFGGAPRKPKMKHVTENPEKPNGEYKTKEEQA